MKALITGSAGFVGRYLRAELEGNGFEVTGLDLQADPKTLAADLMNPEETQAAARAVMPDVIFHLAGQADVGRSWKWSFTWPARRMWAGAGGCRSRRLR